MIALSPSARAHGTLESSCFARARSTGPAPPLLRGTRLNLRPEVRSAPCPVRRRSDRSPWDRSAPPGTPEIPRERVPAGIFRSVALKPRTRRPDRRIRAQPPLDSLACALLRGGHAAVERWARRATSFKSSRARPAPHPPEPDPLPQGGKHPQVSTGRTVTLPNGRVSWQFRKAAESCWF
jgi:hypothetical protein